MFRILHKLMYKYGLQHDHFSINKISNLILLIANIKGIITYTIYFPKNMNYFLISIYVCAQLWTQYLCLQKFICRNRIISNVMVLRGGAFGRRLGREGGALKSRNGALRKRPQRAPSPLLQVSAQGEGCL